MLRGIPRDRSPSILKVGLASVNEDQQYLNGEQAKQNITKYINEYLPAEYENCLDGLNNILTEAWQMSFNGEKGKDASLIIGQRVLRNETRLAQFCYSYRQSSKVCCESQ